MNIETIIPFIPTSSEITEDMFQHSKDTNFRSDTNDTMISVSFYEENKKLGWRNGGYFIKVDGKLVADYKKFSKHFSNKLRNLLILNEIIEYEIV